MTTNEQPQHDIPIACTATTEGARAQEARFASLVERGLLHRERTADGAALWFRDEPGVEGLLWETVAFELRCCAFFRFCVSREPGAIRLDVHAPPEAQDYVAFFAG